MGAVESCAREVREAILSGEIPAGVRLPPERALAERFGVNRVTVRGALARLEAEGLVDVRQGSGYTVRPWQRSGGVELASALLEMTRGSREREAIHADLLLVRRQLARAVLERLAERRIDDESLRSIEAAIAQLALRVERGAGVEEIASADLDVAAAVVGATKSAVLALCLNPVASLLAGLPRLKEAMFRAPEENVLAWRALVAWLRGGCSRAGLSRLEGALEERDRRTMEMKR